MARSAKWGFGEKSNPDYEWLEFLGDIDEILGRKPEGCERRNVGRYLRFNTTCFKDRPEPLKPFQRKRMREMIREAMLTGGKVPDGHALTRIYKSVKGKKKKELWK